VNAIWVKHLPAFVRNKLDGRHHLQLAIGNTGWLFADKILRMGVGLAVGVWLARYLGPGQFGLYSYAFAFTALFGALATLGLDSIVIRELVQDIAAKDEILGATFALKLIGGIVTLFATVAAIALLRPADHVTHWLVAIIAAGTIFQAFDAVDFWFQARVESKFSVYAKNGAFLLMSLARTGLILVGASLIAFAWAALAEVILGSFGLLLIYRLSGQHISAWKVRVRRAKHLLLESWPLILASVAVMVYMKIDQVMLGEMLGDHAVGVYSAAVRISEIWYFIPLAIASSVTPALIEAKKVSEELYYRRIAKLFRLMAGIAFAIAIPMTFASNLVMDVLYGRDYIEAGPVLAIHIWAAVFVFLGVAQGPWTVNEGLTKLALFRTAVGAIVNIALNLVLIPGYGVIGAAIATIISYALSAFVLNAFSARTRRIFFLQLNAMIPLRTVQK
jgi:PST family polysaccharide transporter